MAMTDGNMSGQHTSTFNADDDYLIPPPTTRGAPTTPYKPPDPADSVPQTLAIQLRVSSQTYLFNNGDGTQSWYLCNLHGTVVDPGELIVNDPSGAFGAVGWYTERVIVTMGFTNEAAMTFDVERMDAAPTNAAMHATSQSTISKSLGVGFFGLQGTATSNQSISNSFGYSLEDFELHATELKYSVVHDHQLTALKGGGFTATIPTAFDSTVPVTVADGSATDSRVNLRFYYGMPPDQNGQGQVGSPLPVRAIKSFDIGSQSLWLVHATRDSFAKQPFMSTLPFEVNITWQGHYYNGHFVDGVGTGYGPGIDQVIQYSRTWQFPVDFSRSVN